MIYFSLISPHQIFNQTQLIPYEINIVCYEVCIRLKKNCHLYNFNMRINTKLRRILFISALFVLNYGKAIANPIAQQNDIKTFTEYCQQKSTLPKETKHTVEVLLKKAGTKDCQQANRKLTSLTELDISIFEVAVTLFF